MLRNAVRARQDRRMEELSPCYGCKGLTRRPDQYLGLECWSQLSAETRAALERRDGHALARYATLLRALRAGTSLEDIVVE